MKKMDIHRAPLFRAFLTSLVYLLAGCLWIALADGLVDAGSTAPATLSLAQSYKGFLFVLVTAVILFVVLYRQLKHDRRMLSLHSRQQQEILRLNQFRESVIERANIWINVLDTDGRVVLWNRAAEEISGYTRDEVMETDDLWVWLYPDAEIRESILQRVSEILRDEGEVVGFETCIRTKEGRERTISWNSRSLRDDQSAIIGSIAIGQDITDIRRAEQTLRMRDRQLGNLMDNLPGMAYRCCYDEHWTMLFASSGCRDLTGYDPDELLHNRVVSFASLIDEGFNDRVVADVESAIGNAEPYALEYPIQHKDGKTVWVWERGRAVVDGDDLVLEGIIIDVTDRKSLEAELSQLASSRPRRVREGPDIGSGNS